jgi:hypothetical protein
LELANSSDGRPTSLGDEAVGFTDWLGFIEIGDNSLCTIVSLKEIEMSSQ